MNLKGINHIVIIIGTESNKIMKYGNIMKSPVTYKGPIGSLYYTKCTMELPRGHIIVYRTNQRRIYRDLVFQMDIFLRIFQIWTFFVLSIYIERTKNVHI